VIFFEFTYPTIKDFKVQFLWFEVIKGLKDSLSNLLFVQVVQDKLANNTRMFLKNYCSQIWLNLFVDHHGFGYITKLKKKTLSQDDLFLFQL
jgi:hypothetical protein